MEPPGMCAVIDCCGTEGRTEKYLPKASVAFRVVSRQVV